MSQNHHQNVWLGISYAILAAFSFAVMSIFVKKIGHSLPTSMLIFFRFGISLLLLIPWIIIKERNFSFKINQPFRYLIRIIASLLALFGVFYSIKYIPLVDALLLSNTAPLFVPIIVFILTGLKTPKKAWLGIILGFIGIIAILNPDRELFSPIALIALASGILAALAIVQLRLMSKTNSATQMLFWYFLISTVVIGILAIFQWQPIPNINIWIDLVAIGIFGALYQTFSTLAYVKASVRLVSPFIFLIVVFGGIFNWLLWHHVPNLLTISGSLLAIVGAIITVYFGQTNLAKK